MRIPFFFIIAYFSFMGNIRSQTPVNYIRQEFPGIYEQYAAKLDGQNAHYIFAIDVSSFMQTNMLNIRPLIRDFINALPNGDQVTFIRKSSTNNSDFVAGIRNIRIDASTKNHLIEVLNGAEFSVQAAGSDGYRMTEKIIDAIITTGGSNLVFVFMFTDFEYWTQQNQYNKSSQNWETLAQKLNPYLADRSRVVLPYAVFFPDAPPYRPQADYRNELRQIFGGLQSPPTQNSLVLKNFFNQMSTANLAFRLKHLIAMDLNTMSLNPTLRFKNDILTADLSNDSELGLFSGYRVDSLKYPSSWKDNIIPSEGISNDIRNIKLFQINRNNKPWLPIIKNIDGSITFNIIPITKYENELEKLNSLESFINLDYNKPQVFTLTTPSKWYYFHIFPLWLNVIILLFIIFSFWITYVRCLKPERTFNGRSPEARFFISEYGREKIFVSSLDIYSKKSEVSINSAEIKNLPIGLQSFIIYFAPRKPLLPFLFKPIRGTYIYANFENDFNCEIKDYGDNVYEFIVPKNKNSSTLLPKSFASITLKTVFKSPEGDFLNFLIFIE